MKEKPFSVRKQIYTAKDGIGKVAIYHPIVRFSVDEPYCFLPAEYSCTGFIGYENEEEALKSAESLYKQYLDGSLE